MGVLRISNKAALTDVEAAKEVKRLKKIKKRSPLDKEVAKVKGKRLAKEGLKGLVMIRDAARKVKKKKRKKT